MAASRTGAGQSQDDPGTSWVKENVGVLKGHGVCLEVSPTGQIWDNLAPKYIRAVMD